MYNYLFLVKPSVEEDKRTYRNKQHHENHEAIKASLGQVVEKYQLGFDYIYSGA